MIRFFLVSGTGWVAVLGVGIEAALPYIIRNRSRNMAARESAASLSSRLLSFRDRMWPHYWLGYALVGLVLVHTSCTGPAMERADVTGIWAATIALGLLFVQVGLGLILKSGVSHQQKMRRWHFWGMVGLVGLVLTHLARNG
jgi:hypothetical protein